MKFSIKHALPAWILLVFINTIVNYSFDNGFVLSKFLWSMPIIMGSLWLFHNSALTDEPYEFKKSLLRMLPYSIIGIVGCLIGHYWIYKHLTILNILIYVIVAEITVMVMDRERFEIA